MFAFSKPWPSTAKLSCLVGVGLSLLFMTTSHRVQGQQGRNETVLQTNQVQGTEAVQAFVEDEFIVVLKSDVRGRFRANQAGPNRPTVNVASLQQLVNRHGIGRFK